MPKKATGLYLRSDGKSQVWQWQIKAPKDLRHLYPSEWAYRGSLETHSLPEANLKATRLRAEWLERFDRERRGCTRLKSLTPEVGRTIAQHALTILLKDEAWRMAGAASERRFLRRPLRELGIVGMQGYASDIGLTFDQDAPGVQEAFEHYMDALEAALLSKLPGIPAPPQKPKIPTSLRKVYERWVASDPTRTKDSVRACERALELFEREHPTAAADVASITRETGDSFKAWLQHADRKTAAKTAHGRLNWIKTLLKYAHQDLDLLPKQPWIRMGIKYKANRRPPWAQEQLEAFFSRPLFAKYEIAKTAKAGHDASYWLPLMALYGGARVSELAQLRTVDIRQEEGHWIVDINDDAEWGQVKSNASRRIVPIHSELLRLGFLEYLETTKKGKHDRLWPKLALRENKPGGYFSQWFGEYKGEGYPDFHSFRHTVRTIMARAKLPVTTQDRITGHETNGSVGSKVYTHVSMQDLVEAVEAVRYPSLALPKVYEAPNARLPSQSETQNQ